MTRSRLLLGLGLLLACAGGARTADDALEGTWKVSFSSAFVFEQHGWILKLEKKDGRLTGSVVASSPRVGDSTVTKLAVDNGLLHVVLKAPGGEQTFEGRLGGKDPKKILGSVTDHRRAYQGWLTRTEETQLDKSNVLTQLPLPKLMQEAMMVGSKANSLRFEAQRAKTPEEKAKLLKQAEEAALNAQAETPKLFEKVLTEHAQEPAGYEAGLNLLRSAARAKVNAIQAGKWAVTLQRAAEPHGPRWQREVFLQIAEALAPQEGFAALALEHAQQAEKLLTPDAPAALQVRILKALSTAQTRASKTAEAKQTEARLDRLEDLLDKEYHLKVPPLKVEPFAGRKGQSDRVVVLELFTGAQCPPCVAADVAFDGLLKSYKPADVVFLQYHMHIPGPDPLTNAESEARYGYYAKAFEKGFGGTPSTVFNGKPDAHGGGPLTAATKKYEQYRALLTPLLEQPAGARLKASAARQGSKIDIDVEVADLASPGPDVRLRVVLVEDTVRYQGSNNLRFHHQVVRALPGGADGVALTEKSSKHRLSVDLDELRERLTSYLDAYAQKRPFPNADRPLALRNLRVVAFVQDDKSKEILQGCRADVPGTTAGTP